MTEHHGLKSCPFCGKRPIIDSYLNQKNQPSYSIECENENCEVRPMTNWHKSLDVAVKKWNRRAEK